MTKTALILTLPTMLLAASLAACGEDQPAVCTSIDELQGDVETATDANLTSASGLGKLESALTDIKNDLASVKADAKSEFSTQVDKVETSYAALTSTVDAAKAKPSSTTLAAAATALSTLNTDVKSLFNDVQSTC